MQQTKEKNQNKFIRLFNILLSNWSRAQVSQNAAQMAYFALLALVPLLLIVANVIPLLPIDSNLHIFKTSKERHNICCFEGIIYTR